MRKTKKASLHNIPMVLACVLFCLVMITTHFTGGLYARYTTSASAGDSARVITFGDIALTEEGDFDSDGHMIVTPGVDLVKKVTVDFSGSEADTYIFLEITATGWEHADVDGEQQLYKDINGKRVLQCTVNSAWTYLKSDGNIHVYYQYEDTNKSFTSEVLAPISNTGTSHIKVDENTTKADLDELGTLKLEFRAIAAQAGGFENAAAAWNAVKN